MKDFSTTPITELAAIVATHLREHDIHVVLVGGLAVELYSENVYLTKYIDMVDTSYAKPGKLHKAMAEIGFEKTGRIFVNPSTDITVEFPSPPISVGDELVTETTTMATPAGDLPILVARDVIKDRIAAYIYWRDKPSLVQALAVIIKYPEEVEAVAAFCEKEGSEDLMLLIRDLLAMASERNLIKMEDVEKLVVEQTLQEL
jgi:hypothetical protein